MAVSFRKVALKGTDVLRSEVITTILEELIKCLVKFTDLLLKLRKRYIVLWRHRNHMPLGHATVSLIMLNHRRDTGTPLELLIAKPFIIASITLTTADTHNNTFEAVRHRIRVRDEIAIRTLRERGIQAVKSGMVLRTFKRRRIERGFLLISARLRIFRRHFKTTPWSQIKTIYQD